MSSLNPSASATGNPRNKTALGPGKSLMDWVRLSNSGKDLSGTGGKLLTVTTEQLATHNKKTDAWLAVRGTVYNVTHYMSFHPGGEDELMRGVGIDATKLFNSVHPWVNYESLLKTCVVGRLKTNTTSSPGSEKPINDRVSSLNTNFSLTNISRISSVSEEPNRTIFKMDWFQQTGSLSLIFYFKTDSNVINPPFQVSVSLNQNKYLTIWVEEEVNLYELEEGVRWPCGIKVHQTVAEIRLMKESPKLWSFYGKRLDDKPKLPEFTKGKIVQVSDVTHNTKLIGLQLYDGYIHYMHIGHHVQLKAVVRGEELVRSYTPVSHLLPESNNTQEMLYFIVKGYPTGGLSETLCSCNAGDTLEVGKPRGTFNCMVLRKRLKLVLFAAGTGVTPMTSLIVWTLKSTRLNIILVYFNKTEEDIIWRNEMNKLMSENTRFQVTHVLSEPSSSWIGEKGLVSQSVVNSFLTDRSDDCYVCICGPSEFNNLCINFVSQCGYSEKDYHCFCG